MVSNGLVALSGALLSQYQGFADVSMGRGAIVIGLAAVIIGEDHLRPHLPQLCPQAGGGVHRRRGLLYCPAAGATLGFDANLLKLLSAVVVAVFLAVPYWKGKYFTKPVPKKAQKEEQPHA